MPLRHVGEGSLPHARIGHLFFIVEDGRASELHLGLGMGGHFTLSREG